MSDHENFDDDEKSAENTEVVDETEDLTIPDPKIKWKSDKELYLQHKQAIRIVEEKNVLIYSNIPVVVEAGQYAQFKTGAEKTAAEADSAGRNLFLLKNSARLGAQSEKGGLAAAMKGGIFTPRHMKIIKFDNPADEENPFIVPGFSAVSNDEEDEVKKEYDSRLFVPISHKMAKKSLTYKAFATKLDELCDGKNKEKYEQLREILTDMPDDDEDKKFSKASDIAEFLTLTNHTRVPTSDPALQPKSKAEKEAKAARTAQRKVEKEEKEAKRGNSKRGKKNKRKADDDDDDDDEEDRRLAVREDRIRGMVRPAEDGNMTQVLHGLLAEKSFFDAKALEDHDEKMIELGRLRQKVEDLSSGSGAKKDVRNGKAAASHVAEKFFEGARSSSKKHKKA